MAGIAIIMFVVVCTVLLLGYPVAFTLAGVALWFARLGIGIGAFESAQLLDIASVKATG